ncbi:MAG: hypothetical protein RI958_1280 [Actinomycetota bacterium]|jgi:predicted MFS family arabinose efflux permease
MTGRPTHAVPPAVEAVRPRWGAFALICLAYLVSTTGEQMLSPLFPTASDDLHLTVAQGGIAFGTLTGAIAVTNLVGGFWLRRIDPVRLIGISALIGAAGGAVTAISPGYGVLLAGQVLLGSSAGLFFPAGLQMVGRAAGPARRGFAMGLYGVAFSLGLTMAAVLGALGASAGWRVPFWIAAVLFVVAAGSSLAIRVPAPPPVAGHGTVTLREVMSLPTYVGIVLAVAQYGSVPFLTTFAVDRWGISAASAATVLIVGRLLSIAAKIIGGASADRIGARASARRTSVVLCAFGLAWVLLPGGFVTYAIAAIFAGTVSSLGPVANTLAVERFGQNGMALGAYRSVQIALGALASALVGLIADRVGLRPTLAVAALIPLSLVWICREPVLAPAGSSPAE